MTEEIALPKWSYLNWWPIWMMKNCSKKQQQNTIKIRAKAKLNTEIFEVGQKVRVSNCIRILNDSIFVKFQPLNECSKGAKKEMWAIKEWIVYSRLNYFKVKIIEYSWTEWDEIARETVWNIDKKA